MQAQEAVLVAWGFLEDGSLELLSVSLGNQESYSAWKGFLEDMLRRGITEGHAREAVEMFKKAWGAKYPSAAECLMTDIEACLTYYKYP